MNYENKTREELINELSSLQHQFDAFKALHKANIIAENHLESSTSPDNEKYRIFIELAADAFFQGDKSGNFVEVNQAAIDLTGYCREELLTMNMSNLFSKDLLKAKPLRYDLLKQGEVAKTERLIVRKDGTSLFVEMNSRMMPDFTFQSIFRDISERKRSEEALRESEYRLARAEKVAKIGNWKIELNTKTMVGSIGASIIYGVEVGAGSLENVQKIPLKQYRPELDAALNNLITKNEPYDLEFKICRPSDCKILDIHSIADYDKENNIVYGVVQDITEQKQIEQALTVAKNRAEESDRLKSAFLANMSHEIRTPMNGILGFAELLKEASLTGEQQQEYINIIEKSGRRMLNIINDIVDISKIESGLMKLNICESLVNEQIKYLYNFFNPECEAKGIHLSYVNALPDSDSIIITDREKLYAILTNLLKNAIKFTNSGTIEFGYKIVGTESIVGTECIPSLQFYVKDTGIGISDDRQDVIFERFIQADISDKMAKQGAGLGLSISKAYVTMLEGKMWLESEIGKGSVFYFSIPYNVSAEQSNDTDFARKADEHPIKKLKILIAEDNEISKVLLTITLKKFSKEFITANTGIQAIELCRNNPDIDLILMDIKMPDMDGYEATRQIRSFNKDVIIIAQTAYGLSGDKEKAIEAGCNEYLSKPVSRNDLFSMLYSCFE